MCVLCDASPKEGEHLKVAVLDVHACSSQLQYLTSDCLERSEIKLLSAVEASVLSGSLSCLHSVSTDHLVSAFNKEMVACRIEGVFIAKGEEGGFQTFLKLQIEHQKSQALGRPHIFPRICNPHGILSGRRVAGQNPSAYRTLSGVVFLQ
jgi:hypothetical protein